MTSVEKELNMNQMIQLALDKVKNIMGKGENAGSFSGIFFFQKPYSWVINSLPNDKLLDLSKLKAFTFSSFPTMFSNRFSLRVIKTPIGKEFKARIVW